MPRWMAAILAPLSLTFSLNSFRSSGHQGLCLPFSQRFMDSGFIPALHVDSIRLLPLHRLLPLLLLFRHNRLRVERLQINSHLRGLLFQWLRLDLPPVIAVMEDRQGPQQQQQQGQMEAPV